MSIWHTDEAQEATRQLVMIGWNGGIRWSIRLLCSSCKRSEWDGDWMPYRKTKAEASHIAWFHNDGTLCYAHAIYEKLWKEANPIQYALDQCIPL